MNPHVPEGERDGSRFLHAEETPERPLPMVLLNILTKCNSLVCEHVHALIFAVVGARPARQAQVEWESRPGVAVVTIACRDTVLELDRPVS